LLIFIFKCTVKIMNVKDVDIWERPHECAAEDGRPPGFRRVPRNNWLVEIILPCVAPGVCPWRSKSRPASRFSDLDSSTRRELDAQKVF